MWRSVNHPCPTGNWPASPETPLIWFHLTWSGALILQVLMQWTTASTNDAFVPHRIACRGLKNAGRIDEFHHWFFRRHQYYMIQVDTSLALWFTLPPPPTAVFIKTASHTLESSVKVWMGAAWADWTAVLWDEMEKEINEERGKFHCQEEKGKCHWLGFRFVVIQFERCKDCFQCVWIWEYTLPL